MEIAPELADENKEFYLLHKPVCREDVETTKVRVIYVASAKATKNSPPPPLFLNDCLETGPKPQNLLWHIPVRNQFVFVQISIKPFPRSE